ncbi:hypothetical protein [Ruania halotolerans]|uniref:hypothetical protein n=1 Tax=Ruania halotolerans TaxID=2897773 RepID=UPI001E31ECAC|nr:hypothetical protein [Ruania halotolerans]UFU06741.1 hypothetical protein LQF10_01090 [Ruania halotolerans]
MVIWRGWGILGLLFVLAVGVGLGGLFRLVIGEQYEPLPIGLGLAVAGVALFFAGRWFQGWDARRRADKYIESRRPEVAQTIAAGRFQPVPGYQPASREEAEQLGAEMLEKEHAQVVRKLRGHHTLFFIPVQYFGLVVAVIGGAIGALGLIG